MSQIHIMLPNISTATVHRQGTGHKRCPARARRANVPPQKRSAKDRSRSQHHQDLNIIRTLIKNKKFKKKTEHAKRALHGKKCTYIIAYGLFTKKSAPKIKVKTTISELYMYSLSSEYGGAFSAVRAQCNYLGVWPYWRPTL